MKGPDPRLEAWRAFLTAYRSVLDRLEAELQRERDLPLTWLDVLFQLRLVPERKLTMRQLADAVLLSPSGLTRLVDRMEEAGLVARERCDYDRRKWYILLTREGAGELRSAAPGHLKGIEENFLRHMTSREAEVLTRVFQKMTGPRIATASSRAAGPATS
jgi:DNA-binding MarR family transcriptional regulator